MKREIRVVDEATGTICLTMPDERFYAREVSVDGTVENKQWDFVPSVTWICDTGYPKGVGFYRWLASHGWDEAVEIKALAGDKGGKVHQAIAALIDGGTLNYEVSSFTNRDGAEDTLSPSEWECLMSFKEWFEETKPEVLDAEYTVWNERYRYAGTIDLKVLIDGVVWIIDVKTSSNIWPTFELQLSAYKHADPHAPKGVRLAILQVGYSRNKKKKWKFTAVPDQFGLFLAARKIWKKEMDSVSGPFQREYPLELTLDGVPESL